MTPEPSTDLLVSFLRTDELVTATALTAWFVESGLANAGARATDEDVTAVRRFRAALRSLLNESIGGPVDDRTRPTLEAATAAAPLRLSFAAGAAALESDDGGIAGGLAVLAGLIYRAEVEGTLARVKACKACGWGFYDGSKNRSRIWCDMASCGSQSKARSYRTRKKQAAD